MKKLLLIALVLVPLLSFAQDDIYFNPKKKVEKQITKTNVVRNYRRPANDTVSVAVYSDNKRSDDEYNRRFSYDNGHIVGNDDWQAGGSRYVADSIQAESDSIWATYSRDMNDAEDDYYYSRRLLRFHSPHYVIYRSPYYWDLVYGWGCYDYLDGWYGDPFFGCYGWRYGCPWGPWDCWYGRFWGYYRPYAWDYWGWGGCWGYYSYGYGGYWGGGASSSRPLSQRLGGQRFHDNPFSDRRGGGYNIRTQNHNGSPANYITKHTRNTNFASNANRAGSSRNSSVANRGSNFPGSSRHTSSTPATSNRNASNYTGSRGSSPRGNSYGNGYSHAYTSPTSTPSRSSSYTGSSSSSGSFGGGSYSSGSSSSSSHSGGGGFGGGRSGGGRR